MNAGTAFMNISTQQSGRARNWKAAAHTNAMIAEPVNTSSINLTEKKLSSHAAGWTGSHFGSKPRSA